METQELKNFCKKAKKIRKKNDLPILENILIKDGQMITTNLSEAIVLNDVNFSIKEGLIPLEFFKKVVEKNKEIDLVSKNGTIAIQTPNSVYTLSNEYNIEDFATLPKLKKPEQGQICKSDVQRVKKSINYAADDDSRPVVNTVCVTDKYIVATDAHILSFHERQKKDNLQFLINKKIIEVLDDDSYKVWQDDSMVCMKANAYEYWYKKEESKYPSWEAVIPSEFFSFCKVDAGDMKNTLDEAEPAVNQGTWRILMQNAVDKNILHIQGNDMDFGIGYKCNLVAENSGNSLLIGANLKLLQKIIRTEKYEKLNFKFVDASHAMVINNEILLMSIMIDQNDEDIKVNEKDLNQKPRETKPESKPKPTAKNSKKRTDNKPTKKQKDVMEHEVKAAIQIIEYSEKSIAVIGDTKPLKDDLRAMNGKFNPFLKGENGEHFAGWIFSKKRTEQIKETLNL